MQLALSIMQIFFALFLETKLCFVYEGTTMTHSITCTQWQSVWLVTFLMEAVEKHL